MILSRGIHVQMQMTEEQAWGLCSLSTKTNVFFPLYQTNHRVILAEFGARCGERERERLSD